MKDIGKFSLRTKQNEGNEKMRQVFPLGKKHLYLKRQEKTLLIGE